MTDTSKLKQPKVFNLAFSTALCERFGFYVLTYLLALYVEKVFGLTDVTAFLLFGVFNGLAYITPVIGGYIADHVFGIRRAIICGLFLEANGLLLLALSQKIFFFLGLTFVIVGVGFFKTAPTHLLARSYKDKDPRIDSGFTWFYMLMNIGGFLASIAAGFVQRYFGWHIAFLVPGIVIYLGLLCYFIFRVSARTADSDVGKKPLSAKALGLMLLGIIVIIFISLIALMHTNIAEVVILLASLLLGLFYLYQLIKSPKVEKLQITACLLLVLIGFVFNILYFQAFTSIILFINRVLNRSIGHFVVPPILFFMLNPLWIFVLSPVLASCYKRLGRDGKDLHITTKFAIGLTMISLCFILLKISTLFPNQHMQISMLWIVFAFFIYSLGELLVSALGVAVVSHMAPRRMYGIMMGTWFFVALALANTVSGILAAHVAAIPKAVIHDPHIMLHIYGKAFLEMGLIGLAVSVIAFIAAPYIKKMVHEEDSH